MYQSKPTNMNNTGYGEITNYWITKKYCKSLGMKDSTILDQAINLLWAHRGLWISVFGKHLSILGIF